MSEQQLFNRLKRHLRRGDLHVHKTPEDSKWLGYLGEYYLEEGKYVHSTHVDLVELAREYGVPSLGEKPT